MSTLRPREGAEALAPALEEVVASLQESVSAGRPWIEALLEAVGRWPLPQERVGERTFRYVVGGEAFDWLLLAERLAPYLEGLVPAEELEALLFHGRLPHWVTAGLVRHLVGLNKFRAILNFWYGVVVEQALQLAVEEEVRKEKRANGLPESEEWFEEEAFVRLYGEGRQELFRRFSLETGLASEPADLAGLNEFTYWLFRRRLKMWDPARMASDTRKALRCLHRLRGATVPFPHDASETPPLPPGT